MNKYCRTTGHKAKEIQNSDPAVIAVQPCQHKNDKKALENYTTWLDKRRDVHKELGTKLYRQSGELLMNLGDEYNQVKEEKKALEYTRVPQHFDKYRGNPEWWKLPPGLHDKCAYRRNEVTHFYRKTDVQKNEIPKIEKVGVPGFIKNEKMIFPRTRNVYHLWKNSKYRKNTVKELSSLLKNIEPHKPDFDRLIVLGKTVQNEQEELQTIDPLRMSSSGLIQTRRNPSAYDSSLKCCLKINGVYFYENSQSLSTSRKFHVLFEYDIHSSSLQTQYIVFENVGRVTIRLTWHKLEKFKLFRDISKTTNTEFFCFDKNLLILIPGQIFSFPIWFKTNKVCNVVETWEIRTVPKFWPDTIQVFFVLQAQTHIENFLKRIRTLKTSMNLKAKRRIIKEILEDLSVKSNYQDHKNIDYTYYEPELFEATNFDELEPVPKPKYLYDKTIVDQLKKLYAEIRQHCHPQTWNLKVLDLQVLCRVKDLIDYAEIRTAEFSQYRLMMTSIDIPEEKHGRSTIRNTVSSNLEVERSDLYSIKETKYGRLMKLLWKMHPPCITLNEERVKYFQVYSIFCAYFTLMSTELYQIKTFSTNRNNYPHDLPEKRQRLIFEKFDDTQLNRTKRCYKEDTNAQQKAEKISDVSVSDVHKMYRMYFKDSFSKEVKGKDKRQGEQMKSKGKPKSLPTNMIKTTTEKMSLMNLEFDPYKEVLPRVSLEGAHSMYEEEKTGIADKRELSIIEYLNMYVIIYNYLSKAVDAMVDSLESYKEYRVPHENLNQLKACFKLFVEEEGELDAKEDPVNPFTNPEEREYFEKILRAHLNEVTGQYLICGKMAPVDGERPTTICGEKEQTVQRPEAPSIFTLNDRVLDKIAFEDREMQTLPNMYDYETTSNLSMYSNKSVCECPSDFRLPPSPPSGIFYYSDDEVFDQKPIAEKNSISTEITGVLETSKESIKNKASKEKVSLIEEWNKKKYSIDEMEEMRK